MDDNGGGGGAFVYVCVWVSEYKTWDSEWMAIFVEWREKNVIPFCFLWPKHMHKY